MTLSKYCRMSGINITQVSKESGLSLSDLHIMFNFNPWQFEQLANKICKDV